MILGGYVFPWEPEKYTIPRGERGSAWAKGLAVLGYLAEDAMLQSKQIGMEWRFVSEEQWDEMMALYRADQLVEWDPSQPPIQYPSIPAGEPVRFYVSYVSLENSFLAGDRLVGHGFYTRVAGASGQATKERAPTSDESVSGTWSGTPGSRYQLVDDYPDEAGADYLEHGTTAGDICFGFPALDVPAGRTIHAVQVWALVSEPVAGVNNWYARLKVGGNYYNSGSGSISAGSFRRDHMRWTLNPKTGLAWTVDDVNGVGANALQAFGLRSTDADPVWRASAVRLQVVYSEPHSGVDYIDIDLDPNFESTYVPVEIGDLLEDNLTFGSIAAVVVPWDFPQPVYLYPSDDGRVFYGRESWQSPYPIQVGDKLTHYTLFDAQDVVTEVGPGWFRSVADEGYPKVNFVAGETFWVNRGAAWTTSVIWPWSSAYFPENTPVIQKYDVRITSLTGKLFPVAGYELPYRENVKMKLLLRGEA